jgi:hypothetical protein
LQCHGGSVNHLNAVVVISNCKAAAAPSPFQGEGWGGLMNT